MPKYVATMASNVREYRYAEFECANDESARHRLEDYLHLNWQKADVHGFGDYQPSDATDTVLMLDRRVDGSPTMRDVVKLEIPLHSEMHYSSDARAFVQKVAALDRSSNPVVRALIDEARTICGDAQP